MRRIILRKNSALQLTDWLKKRSCFLAILVGLLFYSCSSVLFAESQISSQGIPQQASTLLEKAPLTNTKIYFYNPEINTAPNLVLKNAWDSFLFTKGRYEFQPVENANDFLSALRKEENAAFIMADWLYQTMYLSNSNTTTKPAISFYGMKDGEITYRKILVANKQSLELEKLTIASSGSRERAIEVLASIYPYMSQSQLTSLKLLLVPKDIDALMAVGYGLADMALSTEVSLNKMAALNGHLYKDMIILKESEPLTRSVLIFKSDNAELKMHLNEVFTHMSEYLHGQRALSLLGLDAWKKQEDISDQTRKIKMDKISFQGGQHNDN